MSRIVWCVLFCLHGILFLWDSCYSCPRRSLRLAGRWLAGGISLLLDAHTHKEKSGLLHSFHSKLDLFRRVESFSLSSIRFKGATMSHIRVNVAFRCVVAFDSSQERVHSRWSGTIILLCANCLQYTVVLTLLRSIIDQLLSEFCKVRYMVVTMSSYINACHYDLLSWFGMKACCWVSLNEWGLSVQIRFKGRL